MESILVTGGAGRVGSQLIKKLLQVYPNTEIISLDNYSTGSRASHQPGAIYMEGDTCDISDIFQEHRFDKIFHLGEALGAQESFHDYEVASNSILIGTTNLLKFATVTGAYLIYSQSLLREEQQTPLSWMKAKQVEQIKLLNKWFGLDYTLCYFANLDRAEQALVDFFILASQSNKQEAFHTDSPKSKSFLKKIFS